MTYPLPTLAAQVTPQGITAPTFTDILESLKASFRAIYGEDAYLAPDSQDGQLLAVFAQALHDCNQSVIAAYHSYSPQTASGESLSNAVKLNNITRRSATRSQVNLLLVGVPGTTIVAGKVSSPVGSLRWELPTTVVIPVSGEITVTATAEQDGALQALSNSLTVIATPTAGWQSVTNPDPAVPGQPVETDAELRVRQQLSPALNSASVMAGLVGALAALPGVTYGKVYENDQAVTDADGIPAHSIACVVKGGVVADIANVIYNKKSLGVGTFGTTSVNVTDPLGALIPISFFVPTEKLVLVEIEIQATANYTAAVGDKIRQAVVDWVNALDIGEDLVVSRLWAPALLNGSVENETYRLNSVEASFDPDPVDTVDLDVAFTEKAIITLDQVLLTVV